jgi:molecular chaperone DnaJ
VSKRDYYQVLGVERGADEQALKSAYRKLALKYHPDRNQGDKDAEERFKEAAEAYGVLSDSQKRALYDRFGHQGLQSSGGAPGFDPAAFSDFSDILGDFFGFGDLFGGGARRRERAQRGEDLRFDVEIPFEDAITGASIDIQVPRLDPCSRCNGNGAEPNDGLTTCSTCRGRGEVVYQQAFLSVRRTCSTCRGTGQIVRRPCTQCRGEGYVRSERRLRLNIPAGVDSGTRMRLASEGQPGARGAPPGDLYVVLRVKEHPVFERHEDDLHCVVPINVAQAALGAEIDLLTFDGLKTVKIPEGAETGTEVRLRGLGAPRVNGGRRGDIVVHVRVETPRKLSREQRRLFEQLREVLPAENEPQQRH